MIRRAPSARHVTCALLLFAAPCSWAQSTPPLDSAPPPADDKSQRVEITGRQNETDQRRQSTAAKIVVGREEIEQFGDTQLSDVLKRLPSVTVGGRPGRGGQIRMRGMGGGYTQILIDGERLPPGFSIDQIAPDMVERIEIYRAPTAETGARAIAGTIDIVLREPLRLTGDELRAGFSEERGRVQPGLTWTRNDTLGERGTYNLTLSATHANTRTDTDDETLTTALADGHVDTVQHLQQHQHDERNSLHLVSRVQWSLGEGDQFSLQPFLSFSEGHSQASGTLEQPIGTDPAPYATSASHGTGRSSLARLAAQLKQHLGESTRMELRGTMGRYRFDSDNHIDELSTAGDPVLDQRSDTTITDRSWSFTGKLSRLAFDQHSLVAGVEAEGVDRAENALTVVNGVPSVPGFEGDISASTRRWAGYLQDEWDPSRTWSVNAGLRWEEIRTRSQSFGLPVANTGIVLAPLLHAVWKFDPPARDQLRLGITRSYRAPTLQNLVGAPSLSTLYPVPGPNTATSPDRAGNPALKPELATGFDIALEHYLGAGGVMSVSAFRRNIHDLIRSVVTLETVPWATSPRWVTRPQNIGDALTQGVELDAKFRLADLMDNAPPLSLRGNLSVFGSRVSGVPGPNNRVDQQPRASANAGGDYRFAGGRLTVGGNLTWTPPYTVQESASQSLSFELKRVADAYVLWALTPATKLRVSAGNFVPRRYVTANTVVTDTQVQTMTARGPTYRVFGLRWEMKL